MASLLKLSPLRQERQLTVTPTGERHVLIIVQNLPVPLDRRVWLECQALRAAGYEVSVICPKGPGDPGYQVHRRRHDLQVPARPGGQRAGRLR